MSEQRDLPDRNLSRKQAAKYLGVSHRTLGDWAYKGGGPPYYKAGKKCVYRLSELDEWLKERRRTSTSDDGQ